MSRHAMFRRTDEKHAPATTLTLRVAIPQVLRVRPRFV